MRLVAEILSPGPDMERTELTVKAGISAAQMHVPRQDMERNGPAEMTLAASAVEAGISPGKCDGFDESISFVHEDAHGASFRYAHITGGYRRAPSSFRECAASLFCLHNETVNIWTHVWGAAVFAYLLVRVVPHMRLERGADSVVIGLYVFSGFVCFALSALYHICTSAPEHVVRCFEKLDHIGVLLLMLGSNLPMIYFGFIGNASFILMHTAMSIGAVALAIGALQFDQMRRLKLYIFLAVVAVGWIQLAHDLSRRGALWSFESNAAAMVRLWYSQTAFFYVELESPTCPSGVRGTHCLPKQSQGADLPPLLFHPVLS